MKNNLYKVEDIVKDVLSRYEETRSDDFILIYRVYLLINENAVIREPFYQIMLNHKNYGLPAFESITRARRKIQKNNPELANEKVKEARINKTSEYIDYALDGGYRPTFKKFIDNCD